MGRILGIDYGRRRCGIAVTDPLCIVATGLRTVPTAELVPFVTAYVAAEAVEEVVVGWPQTLSGRESESMRYIRPGVQRLRKALPPGVRITFFDERFTSSLAHRAMIDGGLPRMARRNRELVDEMAATIILNDYLSSRAHLEGSPPAPTKSPPRKQTNDD